MRYRSVVICKDAARVARSVCVFVRPCAEHTVCALQKRLNEQAAVSGRLVWAQETLDGGCTLAPCGEYDWTIRVQRRCSFMSVYFDRLLLSVESKDNVSICILSCFRPFKGHIHKSRPHGGNGDYVKSGQMWQFTISTEICQIHPILRYYELGGCCSVMLTFMCFTCLYIFYTSKYWLLSEKWTFLMCWLYWLWILVSGDRDTVLLWSYEHGHPQRGGGMDLAKVDMGEGVKKCENFVDILYARSLTLTAELLHISMQAI